VSRTSGNTDIDRVRDATDLVRLVGEHIALTPKGREHVGLCPFHDDRRPSLAVVSHKGDAFYHCFACGASGDCFRFVMEYLKMDFGEALRYLADRAGVTLTPRESRPAGLEATGAGPSRDELRRASAFAADHFRTTLRDERIGADARRVIEERGISAAMVEQFDLGAAAPGFDGLRTRLGASQAAERIALAAGLLRQRTGGDSAGCYDTFRNRLMFPIHDDVGRVIAFGGRVIDPEDQPKYLNSPENALFDKSRTLYGLHLAKRPIIESRRAIVTEGYTDVIACHQAGVTNVVGTLGTALTAEHAKALSRLCDTVVLVFDGDEAGRKAADRAVETFFTEPVDVRICVLPDGLDPDELLKGDDGVERWRTAVDDAAEALEYKLARFEATLGGVGGLSARQKHLEAFLRELGGLGFGTLQGVRKRFVVNRLSELFQVSIADVERAVPRRPARSGAAAPGPVASREAAPPETLIDDAPPVPRARRLAEEELLALLLFDPETAVAVSAAVTPVDFLDPACRRIAEVLMPRLEAGAGATRDGSTGMRHLLADLPDDAARATAARLFREGRERVGADEQTIDEMLERSAATLRRCIDTARYTQQVDALRASRRAAPGASAEEEGEGDGVGGESSGDAESIDVVLDQIRKRTEHGHLPAAISQGVRS
jgi:DNA primase